MVRRIRQRAGRVTARQVFAQRVATHNDVGSVVLLGSSTIADLGAVHGWSNLGVDDLRADDMSDVLSRSRYNVQAKHVILYVGVNDLLYSSQGARELVDSLKTIHGCIHAESVHFVSILSSPLLRVVRGRDVIDAVNDEIIQNTPMTSIHISLPNDCFAWDMLHLNARGRARFIDAVHTALVKSA